MKRERIAALLEKYWQAETTVDEERELAEFFRGADVPSEWESYREVFAYFAHETEIVPSRNLEQQIMRSIHPQRLGLAWWAAAVVIVLVVGLVPVLQPSQPSKLSQTRQSLPSNVLKDTYNDPEQALAAVQKALLTVSKNLNKGLRPLK